MRVQARSIPYLHRLVFGMCIHREEERDTESFESLMLCKVEQYGSVHHLSTYIDIWNTHSTKSHRRDGDKIF